MDAYKNFAEFKELSSIGIRAKEVVRLPNVRGMRMRVEMGAVWITEERGKDDVCLKAGESHCIAHDGTTLISTLRAPFALVTLEPAIPLAPTMAERFWKRFWTHWERLYAPESRPTTASL